MLKKSMLILEIEKIGIVDLTDNEASCAYFILDGIIRRFVIVDGDEITLEIYFPKETVNIFPDMKALSLKDKEIFEILVPAKILMIPHVVLDELCVKFSEVNTLVTNLLSIKVEKILYEAQIARIPSALQRFLLFKRGKDDTLLEKVSSRIIASYLGMKEDTLSQLKAKLKDDTML